MESNLSEILSFNIASLSAILPQFYLTKLKLEYLKSGFKCKKEWYKHRRIFFASLEFDFCRVQLKFAFRIRFSSFISFQLDVYYYCTFLLINLKLQPLCLFFLLLRLALFCSLVLKFWGNLSLRFLWNWSQVIC